MATTKIQVLSESETEILHQKTLEVLEKTGLKLTHTEALQKFDKAGANVDHATQTVRIPRKLTDELISLAPDTAPETGLNGKKLLPGLPFLR